MGHHRMEDSPPLTYGHDSPREAPSTGDGATIEAENARLYREMAEARRRAEQLYRFAESVATADKIETLFDAALHAIETALGVTRAAILTFDERQVMRFRAWRNLSDGYRAKVDGHSPWPPDATAPEPVLVPDAERDPSLSAYVDLFRQERIGALAFVPLTTQGRLVGKFMLYYEHPHDFDPLEIDMAVEMGHHVASLVARFAAVARLEEALRANELLAAVLAHDLRSPLDAMLMAAQVLFKRHKGGTETPSKDATTIGRILSSGHRMERMITQLLDFAQARTGGGIRVVPQNVELDGLCRQAVSELASAHPQWKIQCDLKGSLSGKWDSDRLLQVLSNLLANAGQHGQKGEVIRLTVDGSPTERVRIIVHNRGAIPDERLPLLFDPFATTRASSSRGLGLGLYIVREIARAHGGDVSVSSSPLEGTTFTVDLPRQQHAPAR